MSTPCSPAEAVDRAVAAVHGDPELARVAAWATRLADDHAHIPLCAARLRAAHDAVLAGRAARLPAMAAAPYATLIMPATVLLLLGLL